MSSLATSQPAQALSESQKAALVTLLADDDPEVYRTVRAKILSCGDSAVPWLRQFTLSNDPVLRRRSLEIVTFVSKQKTDNRFLAFCLNHGEDLDLEHGTWLLAQTEYPDINVAAYQALLDGYATDLKERIDFKSDPESILSQINDYLFSELGFGGDEQHYYDADNSYLNRVIDRRTGIPISLSLVYLFTARRLRLPIVGVGMPGHFIVRYQTPMAELFIDAFNKGKLLTKGECIRYLVHTSGFHEAYLAPVSPRRILLRMCSTLHQIYTKLNQPNEVGRLQRYIVALAK